MPTSHSLRDIAKEILTELINYNPDLKPRILEECLNIMKEVVSY